MIIFRTDLHIHTVLSPCGDLEMSPDLIVKRAKEMKLDIIGITDHNSTLQCRVIKHLGLTNNIRVLTGAEVTTREEVHCLTFFNTDDQLDEFQLYLDRHLPDIKNDEKKFGYQVVVDIENNIIKQEERLLISAIDQSLEQLEEKVHQLNGIFIPAHIDKQRFSVIGQLGFLPPDLPVDALEISPFCDKNEYFKQHPELSGYPVISGSDAHYPHQIGSRVTGIELNHPCFDEIKALLEKKDVQRIKIMN